MVLLIGNLKQGSTPQLWQESSTTLQHLTQAKRAKTFPVIDHPAANHPITTQQLPHLITIEPSRWPQAESFCYL